MINQNNILAAQQIEPIVMLNDFNDFIDGTLYLSDNNLKLDSFEKKTDLKWATSEYYNSVFSSLIDQIFFDDSQNVTESNYLPISTRSFDVKYKDAFLNVLRITNFEFGEDNTATFLFADMLEENKESTLNLINQYLVDNNNDESLIVKILSLLNDYSYDELYPYSQVVALASLSNKSMRVRSAAFNLFSHWGNTKSLELLETTAVPTEPWLKMKYNKIKDSLKERWSTQGK